MLKPRRPPRPQLPKRTLTYRSVRQSADGLCLGVSDGGEEAWLEYCSAGDLVRAEVYRENLSGKLARPVEILKKSALRAEPSCPLYFRPGAKRWCGGCDFQHFSCDGQIRAKSEALAAQLSPLGAGFQILPVIRSPQVLRYRNKLQVPFGLRNGKVIAGFFHPGTHEIVDFTDCPVQSELSVRILAEVKKIAAANRWKIYDEDAGRGWLRHLLIRTNSLGRAAVSIVASGEPEFDLEKISAALAAKFPEIKSIHLNVQPKKTSVILGNRWERFLGESLFEEKICGRGFVCYPGSFLQVNTRAAELLYSAVGELLGRATPYLFDVYCGIGVMAVLFSGRFRRVVGIEENSGAAACAWKNARLNKAGNCRFLAGAAEKVFEPGILGGPVSVVLDPPRQGCDSELLFRLKHPLVRRIVYVSCEPKTFARDAGILREGGFVLSKIRPADLFPQTSHIELAACFDRINAPGRKK